MCGIAGYVCNGKYEPKLDMIFPLMGVFMEDRGNESWGYTDGVSIRKQVGPLQDGFDPSFTGAMQAAIHTRHSTTGKVTADNQHPWDFNGLIGMHNGVVYNHHELTKKYDRKLEVDSQHIFQHMIEGKPLSEIEAYGAIVFWKDGVVHLGKFNAGSLEIARTPWGVIFASTYDAIANALKMAGMPKATYYQVENGKLYTIENGQLFVTDVKLDFTEKIAAPQWEDFRRGLGFGHGMGTAAYGPVDKSKVNTNPSVCGMCKHPISNEEAAWDTVGLGFVCDKCGDLYYSSSYDLAGADSHDLDADSDKDDSAFGQFTEISVRQWEPELQITSCDECGETQNGDDRIFVDMRQGFVPFVACSTCALDLVEV